MWLWVYLAGVPLAQALTEQITKELESEGTKIYRGVALTAVIFWPLFGVLVGFASLFQRIYAATK